MNLKEKIRKETRNRPEKFFAVETIKDFGFKRYKCAVCGKSFWSQYERKTCGDSICGNNYLFIKKPPVRKSFDFVGYWSSFARFMDKRGYTPIKRYPVAARWRDDTDFVQASIYDFQPYVVSGEVKPPANPLVVPQFCLRFNDLDNVGITGGHYTGFDMIGQHAFTEPRKYEQDKYFRDMLEWLIDSKGMGIPIEKIILHEDAWSGGGNLGACMEFFSEGLELFNQVYMFYTIDGKKYRELKTRVLDMGMGHERCVWFSRGQKTSYEANMPEAVSYLYRSLSIRPGKEIWEKFLPLAGRLNLDEDYTASWEDISRATGIEKEILKEEVLRMAKLYSLADHTRALLFALNDGVLPSNSGGGYNLRVLIRRCFEYLGVLGTSKDAHISTKVKVEPILKLMEIHTNSLKDMYPELKDKETLGEIEGIVENERTKYINTKKRAKTLLSKISIDDLKKDRGLIMRLYESDGILPEVVSSTLNIKIPTDIYSRLTKGKVEREIKRGYDVSRFPKTEKLYYKDVREFKAMVIGHVGGYIVLDKTAFYPRSGGQDHDTGTLNKGKVTEVLEQEGVVLHAVSGDKMNKNEIVTGKIDWDRRQQLKRHHTATHIINGVCRSLLGNHIWQAGAEKVLDKARLDITHYKRLNKDNLTEIEQRANEIVKKNIKVEKYILEKGEAERRFGFRIYQGGAVPGNKIRIVEIKGVDVEACGGTHCNYTGEVEKIRIIRSKKIQDGIIRIEFMAGPPAREYEKAVENIQSKVGGDLEKLSKTYSVPVERLPQTIERFKKEWKDQEEEIRGLKKLIGVGVETDTGTGRAPKNPEKLFRDWKSQRKQIRKLKNEFFKRYEEGVASKKGVLHTIDTGDRALLIELARHLAKKFDKPVVLEGRGFSVGVGNGAEMYMKGCIKKGKKFSISEF